jgi:inorganic pyrophosphatase
MSWPETLTCIVETPKGSRNKYEYDEQLGRVKLDRFLSSSVVYPTDYGFVPDTLSEDGDTLDALICVSEATFPGCAIEVKPVALLEMEDEHGRDNKVVCVPHGDPAWNDVDDVDDLPQQLRDEITQFFSTYKELEPGKHSHTSGWLGYRDALAATRAARDRFQDHAQARDNQRGSKR